MALNSTAKDSMLEHLKTEILYMSLHSAYPATVENEISGGTPAYARKALTWGTSSGGSVAITNAPAFDVPACTVGAIGLFSAISGGTLYGDYNVTDEVYAAQGVYTVTACSMGLNG